MKKILSLLLSVLLIVTIVPLGTSVLAIETDVEHHLTYTIAGGEVTINGCTDRYGIKSIDIPGALNGYPVTKIGDGAFSNCTELTSVTMTNNVTIIGARAFEMCKKLANINIPTALTSIGESAFYNCESLPSLTIPGTVENISRNTFFECNSMKSIILLDGVKTIGGTAFQYSTGLKSVIIPKSVTRIGDYVLLGCNNLTDIYYCGTEEDWNNIIMDKMANEDLLNATIHFLDKETPAELFTYTIKNDEVTITGLTNAGKAASKIFVPKKIGGYPVTTIGSKAFALCNNIVFISLPDSITKIGSSAFWDCRNLKSITVPSKVTTLEVGTFSRCYSLKTIILPSGITEIKTNAFGDCNSLKKIYYEGTSSQRWNIILDTQDGGFSLSSFYCKDTWKMNDKFAYSILDDEVTIIGLAPEYEPEDLTIPSKIDGYNVTKIDDEAFFKYNNFKNITISNGVTEIGDKAFYSCASLTSVTLPNGLTTIGTSAFDWCKKLTSVEMPDSVTEIKEKAFQTCQSLTSVTIPNGITKISDYTFDGCINLTSVALPNSLETIGISAFNNCSSLPSITIPDSVTNIEVAAFYRCETFASITIPKNVENIGNSAFDNCKNLTAITVSEDNKNYSSEDGVLFNKDKTAIIEYPDGKGGAYVIPNTVTTVGGAFKSCSVSDLTIPSSVTEYSKMAFTCMNLRVVTMLDGVTFVPQYAFHESGLNIIFLPNSIKTIEYGAFSACLRLTDIYFDGTQEEWNAIEVADYNHSLEDATIHFKGDWGNDNPNVDLAVTSVSASRSYLRDGDNANLYCMIRNNGSEDSNKTIKVDFYYNGKLFDTVYYDDVIPSGGFKVIECSKVKSTYVGVHSVKAIVNNDDNQPETDKSNNALKSRLLVRG